MAFAWAGVIFGALCWANRRDRKRLGALGAAAFLALLLARPPQAQAVGLVSGIVTVLRTIGTTLGTWLTNIHTVENDMRQMQQATIWPEQSIQQARGWATGWVRTYESPMRQLFQYRPLSGELPHARDLEHLLADGTGADLGVLESDYRQLYGSVPPSTAMKPEDREMTDMDDALALDTLEQLKRGDRVNEAVRGTGDSLEELSTTAAPGTAPLVSATALVAMLKSQATTQKMLAAYLRQTAAQVAHRTAERKQAVEAAGTLHQSIGNILSRH